MDNGKAKTVQKALAIIEYLLKNEKAKGIIDIAKDLKINSSTVQRIVNTLHEEKYLNQDPPSKKYKLGLKFVEISDCVLNKIDLRRIAAPYLRELRDQTAETVHLMVLDGSMGVYIDAVESPQRSRVVTSIGTQANLHYSAVGKALLAFLPEKTVDNIVKTRGLEAKTCHTITDNFTLKQNLESIKKRGYSIDNEEGEIGTRCVGAPIFGHNAKIVASISIAGPSQRISLKKINDYSSLAKKTANKISNELGNKY